MARERFFTPRLRFKSYDEMNAWLLDKCVAYAKAHRRQIYAACEHLAASRDRGQDGVGGFRGRAPQARAAPRSVRRIPRGDGVGFEDLPRKQVYAACASATAMRFDNNKYSVNASAVGAPVDLHAYADRIVIRQKGRVVAEHARAIRRGATIFNPWHYVPVLVRKPGALRNGAPFKDWVLPGAIERVRRKLAGSAVKCLQTA
jgi:hypothetical protein